MARSIPTEADLGLTPTEEEMAVSAVQPADDDIPLSQDDEPTRVAEPEPEPAKPEEPAEKQPEEQKTVDLRALQEARAAERELKQRNALLETRLNEMLQAFNREQPAQQEQGSGIPPEEDVVGRINWLVSQQAEAVRQRQEAGQRDQVRQALVNIENQFKAHTPDYDDALNFAAQSRENELAMLYPLSTAEQRQQAILEEWNNIVQAAIHSGVNPAEQVYKLAQARGYQKAAPVVQPPVQPAQPAVDVAAVSAAQQRHQSLSDAPGGEVAPPLDAKALASMSDKQFTAWLSQRGNDKKLEQILGG